MINLLGTYFYAKLLDNVKTLKEVNKFLLQLTDKHQF